MCDIGRAKFFKNLVGTTHYTESDPLLGYRFFHVDERKVLLPLSHFSYTWVGEIAGADLAPAAKGRTGLYGFYDCREAFCQASVDHFWHWNDATVFGQVAFFGKIVHHEKGFRAEKAKVLSIIAPGTATRFFEENPKFKVHFVEARGAEKLAETLYDSSK